MESHLTVGFVAEVCRQWREIVLASPRMWSSISYLSQADRALEWLKRSKAVPLQIFFHPRPSATLPNQVAEAVMMEIGRIQEFNICLSPHNILPFLRLNEAASAPLLEQITLISDSPDFSISPETLCRDMPSLRRLELVNIRISSELSPFPNLESLKIIPLTSGIEATSLLSLLHSSPKLEEIEIRLPNLSNIYIGANALGVSAILAHIECPLDAKVTFENTDPHHGEPDLSGLVTICGRLAKTGSPPLDFVLLDGSLDGGFQLNVRGGDRTYILLRLRVEERYYPMLGLAVCSALPIKHNSTLMMEGFGEMTQTEWANAFRSWERVHTLHLVDINIGALMALMKPSSEDPPLSKLHTLYLSFCHLSRGRGSNDRSEFHIVKNLLEERKHLGIPITKVSIKDCTILKEDVDDLMELADIDWDYDDGGSPEEAYWTDSSFGSDM
ncbi:hypothetical protein PLEOSDRAFT_1101277 [Pleurotus ostreatus PC15]|uniref:F-box domain-containing protein n=1 Tax=Pleurotus ostreatus (strain PC15) TaxID=1137138 RepID=A0A067P1L5_PLEO1|nr:hypothetical protein PLEOSDRAFT_1101277 [Pleurotus ostreatus PC15]